MSKDTKELKLVGILEVKNQRMADAQKDLRIAFSLLHGVRSELAGEITDDQFHSLGDVQVIISSVFMNIIDAQIVEKYWDLDQ